MNEAKYDRLRRLGGKVLRHLRAGGSVQDGVDDLPDLVRAICIATDDTLEMDFTICEGHFRLALSPAPTEAP